jgi:hypothetical protein
MQIGGATTYMGADGAFSDASTFEAMTGAIATSFKNAPVTSAASDAVRNGNSLGNVGTARMDIVRVGNLISAHIDSGDKRFSIGPIAGSIEDVTSISLIFNGYAYGGPTNVLTGDAGTHVAIDKIVLEPRRAPGDANGDGDISIADYQIIQANSFTNQAFGNNGDVNYDGAVNFDDFQEWKSLFPGGTAAAEAAIAAIPEPASLGLAAFGVGMLLMARRGRGA